MAGCNELLNFRILGNQRWIRGLAINKPDQVLDPKSLIRVATSTRIFVLGLFASMLFTSKELFFLEPSSYRRATRFNTRQNLPFGCRPRQRSRPQAFSSSPQPWREVRQCNRWVPGGWSGTKRAVESAIRTDNKESGAVWHANAALEQAAYGNPAEARQSAAAHLKLAPTSQGVEVEAALAFAMAGDKARAESLAQDLGKRFPLHNQMQSLWVPAIQAQLSLDKKNPTAALTALQAASSIELGSIPFVTNISCLYHVYIRGEAYLAAGQGSAAAAEFQKILDHSGIVWNCWTGALAHLGVARANALQSRTSQGADADAGRVRALAAYKDFLTLWKDADPDIPVLKQAKAEYAKLQ